MSTKCEVTSLSGAPVESALRQRLAEVQDFYDVATRRIASLEAEIASERTEHDAALAELTRSHTVVELEAQAEIDRLEAAIAAKTAECERLRAALVGPPIQYCVDCGHWIDGNCDIGYVGERGHPNCSHYIVRAALAAKGRG